MAEILADIPDPLENPLEDEASLQGIGHDMPPMPGQPDGYAWADHAPFRPQAEVDDYGFVITPWGGGLAMAPMVEIEVPVVDMTQAEQAVPSMLGGAMQFVRVLQETAMALAMPDMPPPTETRRFPVSMN